MKLLLLALAIASTTAFAQTPSAMMNVGRTAVNKATGSVQVYNMQGGGQVIRIEGAAAEKLFNDMSDIKIVSLGNGEKQKAGLHLTCNQIKKSNRTSHICELSVVDTQGVIGQGGAG